MNAGNWIENDAAAAAARTASERNRNDSDSATTAKIKKSTWWHAMEREEWLKMNQHESNTDIPLELSSEATDIIMTYHH